MGWDSEPVEPAPSPWIFPAVGGADRTGLVAVGADLEPGTLLAAYRQGLFPMPVGRRRIGWWSPDPRGIIPLDGLKVSRSLRRSRSRFEVRTDTCFRDVVVHCGDPQRPHGWISTAIVDAYERLHRIGWAHSVEVYDHGGSLAGGLYGVRVGGLFAGESMFHLQRDASKVALVHLVELLIADGASLLDVQWTTPHLVSLGARDVPRGEYLERLAAAVTTPTSSRPAAAANRP